MANLPIEKVKKQEEKPNSKRSVVGISSKPVVGEFPRVCPNDLAKADVTNL
jgi:hypothetical protein